MIPVREISKRLADVVDVVCAKLLLGGKRDRNMWKAGDASGNPGKSLTVNLEGDKKGRWCDWASADDKGDMLDLWRISRNLSLPEALKEAKEFLGINDPVEAQKSRTYQKPRDNKERSLSDAAMHFLVTERKLEPAIVNRFQVRYHPAIHINCSPPVDHPESIVFPCINLAGDLINRSYRSLPIKGKAKEVWQDAKCAPCLFGWHSLDESALTSRSILLCEGQIDAMSWTQWGIPALSIPNGSGQTWIEYEWENLAVFDTIYVSFDMDGAGRENAERAIQRLGRHRCLIVKIPGKDANECLMVGWDGTEAKKWVSSAKPPPFKNLIRGDEMEKRFLAELQPKPEAFTLEFFKIRWPDQGFYFRPGEVTTWTGKTGNGKSTFLTYLMTSAVLAKQVTFIASMEVKAETTMRKMYCATHQDERQTDASAIRFVQMFGPNIIFADCVGFIEQKLLMEMMWFSFQRYGATQFVVDSLMRINGLEENYEAQGIFMNNLQEFVKQTGSHVHIVAHSRKLADGGKPGTQDVKGSSLITNNADNCVAVIRNEDKMKKIKSGESSYQELANMHDTEISVDKSRDTGWVGSFFLKFDHLRYTFGLMKKLEDMPQPTKYQRGASH